jgi:hypothetical protein
MSRFEEVRDSVEPHVCKLFGPLTHDELNMFVSFEMARVYGMELHQKVNDALEQALCYLPLGLPATLFP